MESMFVVPSGVTASVSIGASPTAVTVTTPAASYYHTAAGGVSSWATAFRTQLSENVQGYPASAVSMAHAVGWGTWSAGWLFNITSGNDTGAFGGVTLTASGTPTYSNEGPRSGIDLAIGFDTNTEYFDGGDNFDVTDTDDFICAMVINVASIPARGQLVQKITGAGAGWQIWLDNATGNLRFQGYDAGTNNLFNLSVTMTTDSWVVVMAVIDRSTNRCRLGFCPLDGSPTVSSDTAVAATTMANAISLRVGDRNDAPGWAPLDTTIAALYVATGSGVATGLSANLSAALTNFANAVNASWSVSLDATSTGRYTISNSFWPFEISWSNTTQRDVAGYEYSVTYPETAAQMALALQYGTWTGGVGYLHNESSGNLASAFGTPATLTANGTPTYSNQGARGGSDKATGFDTNTEYFDGGAAHDIGANDDLLVVWVWKWGSLPSAYGGVFGKVSAAFGNGWSVHCTSDPFVSFFLGAGAAYQVSAAASTVPFYRGQYCVGIACVDRSTGKARIGVRSLTDGSSSVSSELTVTGSFSNAATLRYGANAWINAATDCQVSAFYVVSGSGVATGLSANLSTALSNFASYMKSQTGTQQAKGLWFPDSPFNCDDHPSMAPRESDLRTSESPTGLAFGLCGNERYAHTNILYERSPVAQIREASATYDNGSLEVFWRDTQTAQGGIPWFTPASPVQIYWNNAGTLELVGSDANDGEGVAGWTISGASNFSQIAKPSQRGWVGAFDVRFPRLVSDG
jgi:hypothetical protein